MTVLRRIGKYTAGLLAIGVLVVVSGLVPLTGGPGEWSVGYVIMQFVKGRSIATHSIGVREPPLESSWMVLKGAGHYETTCRACHGAPSSPITRISFGMDPPPPNLAARAARWTDGELFSIVKHGIAFTGMPEWPSQSRDDEVWAMVAFMRTLPRLGPMQYERLVAGESAAAPAALRECARCHGVDGSGRDGPAFPRLAGQSAMYIQRALEAFAAGTRHSGIMKPVAAELSRAVIDAAARYFSALPFPPPAAEGDVSEGERIAMRGIPGQKVPACRQCHGPAAGPRNPAYPNLAGQYAEYLELQLQLFAANGRGGSRYAELMMNVAPFLTPRQMRDVAKYYASLNGSMQPSVTSAPLP